MSDSVITSLSRETYRLPPRVRLRPSGALDRPRRHVDDRARSCSRLAFGCQWRRQGSPTSWRARLGCGFALVDQRRPDPLALHGRGNFQMIAPWSPKFGRRSYGRCFSWTCSGGVQSPTNSAVPEPLPPERTAPCLIPFRSGRLKEEGCIP